MNKDYLDVGKVIPGAKKYNYITNYSDLEDEELINQYIAAQKKNIWKKEASYSNNEYCDFLIKTLRASIRTKPIKETLEAIKSFVQKVALIRDMCEEVKDSSDKLKALILALNSGYRTDKTIFYKRVNPFNISEDSFRDKKDNKANKTTTSRKRSPRAVLKQLKELKREGIDYRDNKDITSKELLEEFSFYGIQYGNWVKDKERVELVNRTYDSLKDLAYILDIDSSKVTFNNTLSIAFGARGAGKALAHYEPDLKVINLTRLKGAGSLAHEWGHGFDHFLGVTSNYENFLSEHGYIELESFKKLVRYLRSPKSNFSKASSLLDSLENRKKSYWNSTSEKFARAFNTYVIDKLEEKGIRNDFLATVPEYYFKDKEEEIFNPNPQGEERRELKVLFDNLFKELKEKEIL